MPTRDAFTFLLALIVLDILFSRAAIDPEQARYDREFEGIAHAFHEHD